MGRMDNVTNTLTPIKTTEKTDNIMARNCYNARKRVKGRELGNFSKASVEGSKSFH